MQNEEQDTTASEKSETSSSNPVNPEMVTSSPSTKPYKKLALFILIIILLGVIGYFLWQHFHHSKNVETALNTNTSQQPESSTQPKVQGLQLDTSKNYGNKYKDGILPVGDGKYTTSAPKQGYVYACSQYAQNLATSQGGAMTRGPWFSSDGKTYDINKKAHVEGSVRWTGSFSNTVNGNTRTIISNDLPLADPTGIFPIESSDPAYSYDHNPNTIQAQSFTYSLPASPAYSSKPNCEGGQVGVMLTGVALFNALDAGGRDAGAWEVQDDCDGHPQEQGVYHYHTLSSCIKNVSVNNVIGFALDGFPITGPEISKNNILTTDDLDECHGIVSQINLNGKTVTMYHYVMTEDFPYSVSCYRGTPIQPPGLNQQQQAQSQGQIPNRPPRPPATH